MDRVTFAYRGIVRDLVTFGAGEFIDATKSP
jgi:hypothetical protein